MFEYPCGLSPRLDSRHVGSRGVQFSALPFGGNMVNILTGLRGTPGSNAPVSGIGAFGPFTTVPNIATSGLGYTGFSTLNSPSATFAIIGMFNSTIANSCLVQGDGAGVGGNGFMLRGINRVIQIGVKPSFTSILTSLTLTASIPYFVVVSVNASASNWAMARLDTGALTAGSGAGLTSTAPNGGVTVGNFGVAASNCPDFSFAAAMWGQGFLSKMECFQWAADPWSFWYSDKSA